MNNNQEHHLAYHKKNDIAFSDILPDSEISEDAANSDKFSRNIVNNSEESESSDKCSMLSLKHIITSNMGIFFTAPKKHELTGKRIWDTKHCCYYCQEIVTKMPSHLESRHRNEDDVVELKQLPLKSKERTLAIEKLTRVGDYYHNLEVISCENGELFLLRRSSDNSHQRFTEYGPCPACFGFVLRTDLWRHAKICQHFNKPVNETGESETYEYKSRSNIKRESINLTACATNRGVSVAFNKSILSLMRDDEITAVVRSDWLIFYTHAESQKI